MVVKYVIVYETSVLEDVQRLPKVIRERVKIDIEKKLTLYPDKFGKFLRKSLNGYRKLRVGDYRIVFRIDGSKVKSQDFRD